MLLSNRTLQITPYGGGNLVPEVYVPTNQPKDGIASFRTDDDVPVKRKNITFGVRETDAGNFKVTLRAKRPVVQTTVVDGIESHEVVRVIHADLTLTFPGDSSIEERHDAMMAVTSALYEQDGFRDVTRDVEPFV